MIKLKGVKKIYEMGEVEVHALRGIDLTIERGEFVSVMGPSGSGKSTLLHILGGVDLPTEGEYLIEDVDITELTDGELSRIRNQHFGFVFQSYNLFPELTALENVMVPLMYARVGLKERKERAIELLKSLDMGHRLNHYPSQLSGGEQQRVAIARALANNPTLLLADEPTGNLATYQGREIMEIFKRLNEEEGVTIVVVTHDPIVGSYGKRLVGLMDGQVVVDRLIEEEETVDIKELIKNVV
ncbi:macrolide ABC transporter ATP-binding protein [Anoxybacter fermentans]|uniref:Macrolide ABC transporter ATP-binding protein n=1 Tax=Anoxybacter fermentans TaxID=1323375 RepID=A0A3S9SYY3_9FIRM|nr:ABC transporter ATP-binding protein [Anoxybacter fermentans]AZR73553.1 macrolide ABC transporter ATP-binding protein [Anoxybacter fermentans]